MLVNQIEYAITEYNEDIRNGRFSDFDLEDYKKISSWINSVIIPSKCMIKFMQLDVLSCVKKQLLADVSALLLRFLQLSADYRWAEYIKIQDKIECLTKIDKKFVWLDKEFKSLGKRIKNKHDKIFDAYEEISNLLEKVKLDTDISNFNKKFVNGENVKLAEYKSICDRIKCLTDITEEMQSFLSRTDYIEFLQRIENYENMDLLDFIIEYKKIRKQKKSVPMQEILLERLQYIHIDKIVSWFKNHVTDGNKPYIIDKEQAAAIVDNHKNLLVKALAGSGKTRTLVAKIVYLVAICKVSESEIIAFVFNNKASEEINARLKEIKVDGRQIITKPLASTFHSFAYSNTDHSKILSDNDGKDRSLFIQDIVCSIIHQETIYGFFRKEATKIGREQFASDEDFYKALRSRQFDTLDNKKVKSLGEKIICDLLFEYGIKYTYEPNVYTSNLFSITIPEKLDFIQKKDCVKPDFLLTDYNMVWEHWAITGNETPNEVHQIDKKGVIGKYSNYKDNMIWKREFYERKWIDSSKQPDNRYAKQVIDWKDFIETNYDENLSRENFEQHIIELLKAHGIEKQKLPKEELVRKVWNKRINHFTSLVVQFIDRTEQEYIQDISILEEKIKNVPEYTRERIFLDIALKVYVAYREKLAKNPIYDMDFSILMDRVSTEILSNSDIHDKIASKKYILIDEFQDFSKLFLNFINAVKQINSEFHLMCVGDDYQAINRFAGSDVGYFINFAKYFPEDSNVLNISTNYRCDSSIVANAKDFMSKKMDSDINFTSHKTAPGTVNLLDVNQVFIENRQDRKNKYDNIFKKAMIVQDDRSPDKKAIQYLKSVAWIINKHKDKKSIKILHRNNDMSFWNIDLNLFYKKLKETCVILQIMEEKEFYQKVSIGTMHSAKGLEADVVILLEVDDSIIPCVHPDSSLFKIFGETEKVVIDDQKRLFYVALTRAEDDLYILYDGEKKSEFLNDLPIAKELEPKNIRF